MDFESLYGTAEGMVEILPVIPKKGWTPPNGIKLHQSKVRGTVRCISCGKPRSFFSASRIKDRKLFTKGLEEIEFECGQPLFEVGSKPYQKEFAEVVVVNQNLDCESPIEVVYYSKKLGPIRCYLCAIDLTSDPERLKIYEEKKLIYSVVLPTCDSCGDPKCSHKRKNALKQSKPKP